MPHNYPTFDIVIQQNFSFLHKSLFSISDEYLHQDSINSAWQRILKIKSMFWRKNVIKNMKKQEWFMVRTSMYTFNKGEDILCCRYEVALRIWIIFIETMYLKIYISRNEYFRKLECHETYFFLGNTFVITVHFVL